MVLADSTTHVSLPNPPQIAYMRSTANPCDKRGSSLVRRTEMVTGVFTLNDYDYESPGKNLIAKADYNYQFEHGIWSFISISATMTNGTRE